MSRQTGTEKVDFESKGSGMGPPYQAGWPCHPRNEKKRGNKVARWHRATWHNRHL